MEKDINEIDPVISINKKLMELTFPFELLPESVKGTAMDFIVFRRELTKESDRGCALLAVAYLDSLLEKVLRKILCGSNNHLDSLFDFNGPLGTFSGKILLTYSLGFFSKHHLDDIQKIRKIRNEFGHSTNIISFDDPKIAELTNGLKLVANSKANTSRKRFIASASFISGTLEALFLTEEKIKESKEVDVEERKNMGDKFVQIIYELLDMKAEK